jgi:hypothetical protein
MILPGVLTLIDARHEKASEAAGADVRVKQLLGFLGGLEKRIPTFREPYGERAAVWIKVVRDRLGEPNPCDRILGECWSKSRWES